MLARLRNLPYRRRAALLAASGLVVIAALTIIVLSLIGRALRVQTETRARETAGLSARLLSEQARRLGSQVSAFASDLQGIEIAANAVDPDSRGRVRRVLRAITADDGVEFASVASTDGRLVASVPSQPELIGRDFSMRDWYRGVTRVRSPYVSRTYRASTPGHPRVVAVAALVRSDGTTRAILIAAERSQTQRFVNAFAREQDTGLTVMDQGGTIVADSASARSEQLIAQTDDPAVMRGLRGEQTMRANTGGGELTVSAYAPVPSIGWVVRSDVRSSVAFGEILQIRLLVLALAGLFSAALVALAVALSRSAARGEGQRLNERLQAQLLPRVRVRATDITLDTVYFPGEAGMLIGGDFHDAIELEDGRLAVIVGDVVGHGPDAAALGAALRSGWRISVLSGLEPSAVMAALDRAVRTERRSPDAFSSALCAVVAADRRTISFCTAGHPAPILARDERVTTVDVARGPLLGVLDDVDWPLTTIDLAAPWSVVLYTDGLIEGSAGRRLDAGEGEATLRAWIGELEPGPIDEFALIALVERSREAAAGVLSDDVAIVAISSVAAKVAGPPASATVPID